MSKGFKIVLVFIESSTPYRQVWLKFDKMDTEMTTEEPMEGNG